MTQSLTQEGGNAGAGNPEKEKKEPAYSDPFQSCVSPLRQGRRSPPPPATLQTTTSAVEASRSPPFLAKPFSPLRDKGSSNSAAKMPRSLDVTQNDDKSDQGSATITSSKMSVATDAASPSAASLQQASSQDAIIMASPQHLATTSPPPTKPAAKNAAVARECDYDKEPTALYKRIEARQWPAVLELLAAADSSDEEEDAEESKAARAATTSVHRLDGRAQARVWVVRKERDGKLRWRLLPLHAALVFQAPLAVVEALLRAYPESAAKKDDQGMLPLHLCARNCPPDFAIWEELLAAHPAAVYVKDRKGRTPLRGGLSAVGKANSPALSVLDLYTQIAAAGEKQRWWTEQQAAASEHLQAVTEQHEAQVRRLQASAERRMAQLQEKHAVTVGTLSQKLKRVQQQQQQKAATAESPPGDLQRQTQRLQAQNAHLEKAVELLLQQQDATLQAWERAEQAHAIQRRAHLQALQDLAQNLQQQRKEEEDGAQATSRRDDPRTPADFRTQFLATAQRLQQQLASSSSTGSCASSVATAENEDEEQETVVSATTTISATSSITALTLCDNSTDEEDSLLSSPRQRVAPNRILSCDMTTITEELDGETTSTGALSQGSADATTTDPASSPAPPMTTTTTKDTATSSNDAEEEKKDDIDDETPPPPTSVSPSPRPRAGVLMSHNGVEILP